MLLRYSEKPLDITQLWKMSFDLSLKSIFQLYFFLLVVNVLQVIPQMIWGNWVVYYGIASLVLPKELAWHWIGLEGLFVAVIMVFLSVAVVHQLGVFLEGNPVKLKDSINLAVRKLPLMFFTMLITYCLVFIGSLLILPGIYLFFILFLVTPVVVFENSGLFKAIKRSISLLWGNWWRTFGVLMLAFLVSAGFMLIMKGFRSFLLMLQMTDHVASISQVALQLVLGPFLSILFYSVIVLLWHDLKLRKTLSQTRHEQKTVVNSSGE